MFLILVGSFLCCVVVAVFSFSGVERLSSFPALSKQKNKTNTNTNRNKVSHVDNVKHRNFTFVAHPTGFLVHRQHARSSADRMYQEQKGKYEAEAARAAAAAAGAGAGADGGGGGGELSDGGAAEKAAADAKAAEEEKVAAGRNLAALTHGFRDAMLAAMRERRYVPSVDEGVEGCLRQLGWWKGYEGMEL
jgi:hypothetical protein